MCKLDQVHTVMYYGFRAMLKIYGTNKYELACSKLIHWPERGSNTVKDGHNQSTLLKQDGHKTCFLLLVNCVLGVYSVYLEVVT